MIDLNSFKVNTLYTKVGRDVYTPILKDILCRDDEIAQCRAALATLPGERLPRNVCIYGNPGCGKTMILDLVQKEVQENPQGTKNMVWVMPFRIGKNVETGLYKEIIDSIESQFNIEHVRIKNSTPAYLTRLQERMDQTQANVLIRLDLGVANIRSVFEALQPIQYINGERRVAIIYTTTTCSGSDNEMFDTTIHFPPYSKEQLDVITLSIIKEVFKPNSITEEAIDKCTTFIANRTGDIRAILHILDTAEHNVSIANRQQITADDIEYVIDYIYRNGAMKQTIKSLPLYPKISLVSVKLLCNGDDKWKNKKDLVTVIELVKQVINIQETSIGSIRQHLQSHELSGIIATKKGTVLTGTKFKLTISPETIDSALESDPMFSVFATLSLQTNADEWTLVPLKKEKYS